MLFRLYLRKYVNDLAIHFQKSTFAKFTADFSCNFTNFDLEFHGQASVKIELAMVGLVFMKFRKSREVSTEKKKSSISIKIWYFHCLSNSLFYWPLQLSKGYFQKIDLYKLNLVPRGTRLIDIKYLKLCNALLQIWCIRCYTPQFVVLYEIWKSVSYSLL